MVVISKRADLEASLTRSIAIKIAETLYRNPEPYDFLDDHFAQPYMQTVGRQYDILTLQALSKLEIDHPDIIKAVIQSTQASVIYVEGIRTLSAIHPKGKESRNLVSEYLCDTKYQGTKALEDLAEEMQIQCSN